MSDIDKKEHKKKKHSIAKKIAKIIFIPLAVIILLIAIAVGTTLYMVFTPEKTTKIVNHFANELLNADVNFQNIDITFLSTYPDFYLTINEGNIVSKAFEKTAEKYPTAKDSLLSFSSCRIKLDPIKYLETKDLEINTIYLDGIKAFVFTDSTGKANWEIFPLSEEDTTTTEFILEDYLHSASIENIEITSGKIVYDDQYANLYGKFDEMAIKLNGNFFDPNADLHLTLDLNKIEFRTDTTTLVKNLDIDFATQLSANIDGISIDLAQADLSINDIAFAADGTILLANSNKIDVDARLHASVPAIDLAKKMIPTAIVPIVSTIEASGSLDIDAEVKGLYSQTSYPTIATDITIGNAAFKHQSINFWIDCINLDANAFVDLNNNTPSHATIKNFSLKSVCANIEAQATANNVLKNPAIKAHLATTIDIDSTLHYFPVVSDMSIKGQTDITLYANTKLSYITNQQWDKIKAQATMHLNNIAADIPADTMSISFPKATIKVNPTTGNNHNAALAWADIEIDSINIAYATMANGSIGKTRVQASVTPENSNTVMLAVADLDLTNANLEMMGNMHYASHKTKLKVCMEPNAEAQQSPTLKCDISTANTKFETDSINAIFDKLNLGIDLKPIKQLTNDQYAYRNLTTEQTIDYLLKPFTDTTQQADLLQTLTEQWKISTNFSINGTTANLSMLNYAVNMPSMKLSLSNDNLELKNLIVSAKNSDLQMSGTINNITKALVGKEKFKGNLSIKSNTLNINELMNVMVVSESTTTATDSLLATTDTVVPMSVIEVPDNINISLYTDIKQAIYGKANFSNIQGEVVLKNQSILLDNLNFTSDLGAMNITLLYKAIDQTKADFSAELKIDKLNINTLTTKVPAVDTMLPMLRSFEGLISTDIIAVGEFDSTLNINMPSLVASCYLRGDSLVLLDNKTFQKFSKLLLFKNKERNLIDSLAVEIIMKQQVVSFMPFVLQLDRYKVGITGTQYMNMDFDYNVSVLEWPLGINMFVKYKGNMDDIDNAKLKIKIGEKKYSKEYQRTKTFSAVRRQWKNIIIQKRKDILTE